MIIRLFDHVKYVIASKENLTYTAYQTFRLLLCNNEISFLYNDIVYTYPCVFQRSISLNSDGTDIGKYFPTNDEIGSLQFQNNAATLNIIQ